MTALESDDPPLSPASPASYSDNALPLSPVSPRLQQAVEPVLMMPDDEEEEEEAEQVEDAAGAAADEGRSLLREPAASQAAQQRQPSPRAVDEPSSSSDEAEEISVPSKPATKGKKSSAQPSYATSLWHAVPTVMAQSENGRQTSKALGSFLRAKAELDRSYAADLRRLTTKWAGELPSRPSPAQSGTMVAGMCALRNAVLAAATNTEILAEKIDESVAEPFLDVAADAEEEGRALERECKALCKELEQAMDHLVSAKQALQRACADLATLRAEEAAGGAKGSNGASSDDWMSQLFGSVAPAFRSSASELQTKKIPALDAKYTAAIKHAREVRARFDRAIGEKLAAFEAAEVTRLDNAKRMSTAFTQTHAACMQSTAKHMEAVRAAIEQCKPKKDIALFLETQVRRLGQDRKAPPPLPIYRVPKGHPNYRGSTGGSQAARARKSTKGASAAVDEPDSDSEEDLSLSDATDSEQDEADSAEDDEEDSDDEDPRTRADRDAAASAALGSSPEQVHAETAFTQLLGQLVALPLDTPVGSVPQLETQVELAGGELESAAGRAGLAAVLKRAVNSAGASLAAVTAALPAVDAAVDAAEPAEPSNVLSPALDAQNGLAPVEPVAAPASPEIDASSAPAVAPASFSAVTLPAAVLTAAYPSDPNATLSLSPAAFDILSALLMHLLDACVRSMHAQPAISVLRSSRRLLLASSEDEAEAAVAAEPLDEEHVAEPTARAARESVLLRLSAHEVCSSPRLWELAFLESLSRARRRRAPVHSWQTDAEQAGSEHAAAQLALHLLLRYANDLLSLSQLSDAAIASFVDKFALMHHLDSPRAPAGALATLLQLPCFTRLHMSTLPSIAKAKETKQKMEQQQKDMQQKAQAARAAATASSKPLPFALPVARAAAGDNQPAGASAAQKQPIGRSLLQAPRPPFDTAFEDAEDASGSPP